MSAQQLINRKSRTIGGPTKIARDYEEEQRLIDQIAPRMGPPPSYPTLPDGPSTRRVLMSFIMQAATIAIIIHSMQRTGLLDVISGLIIAYNPWVLPCGWLPYKEFILASNRVISNYHMGPGAVHIRGGRIVMVAVGREDTDRTAMIQTILRTTSATLPIIDHGNAVIGPGLIDGHVHINEPGREDWEGMATATKAAAAGGITTVVDMPLNSHPCTTTVKELKKKLRIAKSTNKTHCDVGFWAGLVPANSRTPRVLKSLVAHGALGFKAFLSPSGINDFPNVTLEDIRAALPTIIKLKVPLLVHAELVDVLEDTCTDGKDPRNYQTYLSSRPSRFEQRAAKELISVLDDMALPSYPQGFGIHIVHVADQGALHELHAAVARGVPLTIETCPHYLQFSSEDVPDGATQFKCAPPIRDAANKEGLIGGVVDGMFHGIATDHSPSPIDMKNLTTGDFVAAWGGISGLQYALPATWDVLQQRGMSPMTLHALWSRFPSQLVGLKKFKGMLAQGKYADIVVWSPEEDADTSEASLFHKYKLTPYAGRKMKGKVLATYVRGSKVFDSEMGMAPESCGSTVWRYDVHKR